MYLYVNWMSVFTDFWLRDNLIFLKDYKIILHINPILWCKLLSRFNLYYMTYKFNFIKKLSLTTWPLQMFSVCRLGILELTTAEWKYDRIKHFAEIFERNVKKNALDISRTSENYAWRKRVRRLKVMESGGFVWKWNKFYKTSLKMSLSGRILFFVRPSGFEIITTSSQACPMFGA